MFVEVSFFSQLSENVKASFKPNIASTLTGPLKMINFQRVQQKILFKLMTDFVSLFRWFRRLTKFSHPTEIEMQESSSGEGEAGAGSLRDEARVQEDGHAT